MTVSSHPSRWDFNEDEKMHDRGFHNLPLGTKLFVSLFLCLFGLAYASFLGEIWIDTRMQIPLIAGAYGDMSTMELVTHSFRYLAWFATAFAAVGGAFLYASYPQRWKLLFSLWAPVWIVSDITAAWLIRYADIFAWQLFVSGFVLAATFLALFILVQWDLWLKK